jgi:hypothetical protein
MNDTDNTDNATAKDTDKDTDKDFTDPIKWEPVPMSDDSAPAANVTVYRSKVDGRGWFVLFRDTAMGPNGSSVVFLDDPNEMWGVGARSAKEETEEEVEDEAEEEEEEVEPEPPAKHPAKHPAKSPASHRAGSTTSSKRRGGR